MNLIEMRQGSGTYVKSITPSFLIDPISSTIPMDKDYTNEVLVARLFIEGSIAFLAARKASEKEITDLKELVNLMRKDVIAGNVEDFINRDLQFHLLIAKISKNRVLYRVFQTIQDTLYQFIADYTMSKPERIKLSIKYHNQICKAIENHDPVKAKEKMEAHINSAIKGINSQIKQLYVMMNKSN